ncbi:DUF3574 domain-containing protein [Enterobacteriaceae bacterium H20N1]|uniref:DUF3574 domain-containing protein n=1 Tax=Dryocola boscaweniae TaxID=2925397 RepID=A0A9X2W6V8_9ENTR|nr:DUF3574 domain-containing protein [Dryocola boscaweniae]MCT4702203.1 DUF3574 domain-containing protein [Dryocola boscaweniae]MCT4714409.1 DUF3574 domain-containing protein [Dryocola boscaweniae]MCT4719353.1 DUF3574 domain-containing protein [Dryocola boscaweniae]
MTFYKAATAGLIALALAGCVQPASVKNAATGICPTENTMTQTTLYFGLSRPAGADITAKEWQIFIDNDVTPRFRDGLTTFDAKGQWLGNDGKLAREQSKALMLIHSSGKESESKIEALRDIYKSRFAQDSVMRVDQPVCVQF